MASAVDSRLAYARLSAVATASRLPTANRASNNSYTTSWDTTAFVILVCRPVRNNRNWSATVTPLASIIGSGFLVSVPGLGRLRSDDLENGGAFWH